MDDISQNDLKETGPFSSSVQPATTPPTVPGEQITPNVSPQNIPKTSLIKKLLLIVIITGVLAGGGFFIYSRFVKSQPEKVEPRISLPTSESTKTLETGFVLADNFDGPNIDTNLWNLWTISDRTRTVQNNGKIEIEIPSGSTEYTATGLDFKTVINANSGFEVSVDAEIVQEGTPFGSGVALVFHEGIGEWENQLAIFLAKNDGGGVDIGAYKVLNGEHSSLDFVKSFDRPGPFTIGIKREGGGVIFSYKEGTEFVILGRLTSDYYAGSGIVSLHVNTLEPDFPGVIATFDNFVLKLL